MSSSRPYLIRAMYEWMLDNAATPHLLVDASQGDVQVPQQYVRDGKIVLNIGPAAVKGLVLGNDAIRFEARFEGRPMAVDIPVGRVLSIYTRETGEGMMFESEAPPGPEDTPPPGASQGSGGARPEKGRPRLKVVK